jgi:alkylated DNA repair protein (DNA oxidative demethylase)
MHRDTDERTDAPVVSVSLGDTCVFRFGNTATRTRPYTDVELRSGDLFVFGGPSRWAYHGVPRVFAGTANPALGLESGRINITVRASGLPPAERGPAGASSSEAV